MKKVCLIIVFIFGNLSLLPFCLKGQNPSSSTNTKIEELIGKFERYVKTLLTEENQRLRERAYGNFKELFAREAIVFDFLVKEEPTDFSRFQTSLTNFSDFRGSSISIFGSFNTNRRIIRSTKPSSDYQAFTILDTRIENKGQRKSGRYSIVFYISERNPNQYVINAITEINDFDKDKYSDEEDQCAQDAGPIGGCPDDDNDGVPEKKPGDTNYDYRDLCPGDPGSPNGKGCPDADGDGIEDEEDRCPNEPGKRSNNPACNGCPDTDGDSICDLDDYCPDDFGLAEVNGCPDRDRDAVPDINTRYPNQYDRCPSVKGSSDRSNLDCYGCPDKDADGVCDQKDLCPDTKGSLAADGCVDRDNDGVADIIDNCPDDFGKKLDKTLPEYAKCNGCPDSDGDGFCDAIDKCPQTRYPRNNGCPPEEPISKLNVGLFPTFYLPLSDYGSNSLYNKQTNMFIEGVGLARNGIGGELQLEYNFNPIIGVQLSAGYVSTPYNIDALDGNLKLFFINNSIQVSSIEIDEPTAYKFGYVSLAGKIGYFKTGSRFIFDLSPGLGFLLQNITTKDRVVGLVNYSSGNTSFDTFNFDLAQKGPSLFFRGDVKVAFQLIRDSPSLFLTLKGAYLSSLLSLDNNPITFNSLNPAIIINEQRLNIGSISIGLQYYFGTY